MNDAQNDRNPRTARGELSRELSNAVQTKDIFDAHCHWHLDRRPDAGDNSARLAGALAGAANVARHGGLLFVYGPFKRDGEHTSEGNAVFDESLRRQNDEWGYRDIEAMIAEAEKVGFERAEIVPMPANNFALAMTRS